MGLMLNRARSPASAALISCPSLQTTLSSLIATFPFSTPALMPN